MTSSETCPSSPSFDLINHEFSLAIRSQSVTRIKSKIHSCSSFPDPEQPQTPPTQDILSPARAAVDAALPRASRTLSPLLSAFFDGSQSSSRFALLLYGSIHSARSLYSPFQDLSLSPHHSDRALQTFIYFSSQPNPFDKSSAADLRRRFDDLSGKIRAIRPPSSCCRNPSWRGEMKTQIKKVEEGIFALKENVETMERMVSSLHDRVQNDRVLAEHGIKYGEEDRSFIGEVVRDLKQHFELRMKNLDELQDHVYFFLAAINGARKNLCYLLYHRSSSEDTEEFPPPN